MNSLNYSDALVDEVALEGLDGITFPSLWIRMDERLNINVSAEQRMQSLLWQMAVCHHELRFYCLPEPRRDIQIFDRFANINPFSRVYSHPENLYDVYGYKGIQEGGFIGSCPTFETRKDITTEIRDEELSPLCTYDEAMKRWGRSLVVVASQMLRNMTLTGKTMLPSYITESVDRYCLLELTARSRKNGVATGTMLSEYSTQPLGMTAKFLHYIICFFCRKNLLKKQIMRTRYKDRSVMVNLIHMEKFYHELPDQVTEMRRSIAQHLSQQENKLQLVSELKEVFPNLENKNTYRNVVKNANDLFSAKFIPYSEMYPSAPQADCIHPKSGCEKKVQVMILLREVSEDEEEKKDEEEEEDDEEYSGKKIAQLWLNGPHKLQGSASMIGEIYREIYHAKTEGRSLSQMIWAVRGTYRITRSAVYCLERTKKVTSILKSFGQQRTSVYVAMPFMEASSESFEKAMAEFQQKTTELSKDEVEASTAQEENSTEEEVVPGTPAVMDAGNVEADDSTLDVSVVEESSPAVETAKTVATGTEQEGVSKLSDIVCTFVEDEEVNSGRHIAHPIKEERLTEKMLVLANVLLDVLKQYRVMENLAAIKHAIQKELLKGGTSFPSQKKKKKFENDETVCVKTVLRIINWCHLQHKLNKFNVQLKFKNRVVNVMLITAKDIERDDPLVQSTIERSKLRNFSYLKIKAAPPALTTFSDFARVARHAVAAGSSMGESSRRAANNAKKWEKACMVHRFLWYVIYEYQGHAAGTEQADSARMHVMEEMEMQMEEQTLDEQANGEDREVEEPHVYLDVKDWRRYIPPIEKNKDVGVSLGRSDGVCSIGNMLLVMPLSIFSQLLNLQEMGSIQEYLKDSYKRHYPLTALPFKILGQVLSVKSYLTPLTDTLRNLCTLGLLAVGPLYFQDRKKQFVFLRKSALMLDTRESLPGNLFTVLPEGRDGFPEVNFQFMTMSDVEQYWSQLQIIALNTDLNNIGISDKPCDDIVEVHPLKESMALRRFDEIVEDKYLPGNRLGAAGFDSSLFLHLRRNWSTQQITSTLIEMKKKTMKKKEPAKKAKQPSPSKKPSAKKSKPRNIFTNTDILRLRRIVNERREAHKNALLMKTMRFMPAKYRTPRIGVRQRHAYQEKRKQRKANSWVLDETDKRARTDREGFRTKFSAKEITIIMLGKVAMNFLMGDRSSLVHCRTIRDILRERLPTLAYDKTSKSVKACILRQAKRPNIRLNMSHILSRLLQDKDLRKKYNPHVLTPDQRLPNENSMCEVLYNLINDLLHKFMLPAVGYLTEVLPYCRSILKRHYSVTLNEETTVTDKNWTDVSSYSEICCVALRHFQLSHLLSAGDKQSRNYEMYSTLRNYPDDIVRNNFRELTSGGIIAKNKRTHDSKGKNESIGRYCMHIRHINKIHKARYPVALFSSGLDLLSSLARKDYNGEGPSSAPDGKQYLPLSIGTAVAGHVALVIGLMAKGQLVIKVDASGSVVNMHSSDDSIITEAQDRRYRIRFDRQLADDDYNPASGNVAAGKKRKAARISQGQGDSATSAKRQRKDSSVSVESTPVKDVDNATQQPKERNVKENWRKRPCPTDNVDDKGEDSPPDTKRARLSTDTTPRIKAASRSSGRQPTPWMDNGHMVKDGGDSSINLQVDNVEMQIAKPHMSDGEVMGSQDYKLPNFRVSFTLLALRRVHPEQKLNPRFHSTANRLALNLFPISLAFKEKGNATQTAVENNDMQIERTEVMSIDSNSSEARMTASISSLQQHFASSESGFQRTSWIEPSESGTDDVFVKRELLDSIIDRQTRLLPLINDFENFWMNESKELDCTIFHMYQDVFKTILQGGVLGKTWFELKKSLRMTTADLLTSLDFLENKNLVLKVGVTKYRFVSLLSARQWLIHTLKNNRGRGCVPEDHEGDRVAVLGHGMASNTSGTGGPSQADPTQPGPSVAGPSQAGPSQAGPSQCPAASSANNTPSVAEAGPSIAPKNSSSHAEPHAEGVGSSSGRSVSRRVSGKRVKVTQNEDKVMAPVLPNSTYEKIRLHCRLWRRPEGGLNNKVLKEYLYSLLYYLMRYPGSTLRAVTSFYEGLFNPVDIRDLVQILEKLGCVQLTMLEIQRYSKRTSLFSTRSTVRAFKGPDVLGADLDELVIEPSVDCSHRLGQFLAFLK